MLKKLLAYEPAVILGAIAAVITAVAQEVPAGSHVSWSAVAPLLLAAVVRQFVYSPASVRAVKPGVADAPVNVAASLRAEAGYVSWTTVVVAVLVVVVLLFLLPQV